MKNVYVPLLAFGLASSAGLTGCSANHQEAPSAAACEKTAVATIKQHLIDGSPLKTLVMRAANDPEGAEAVDNQDDFIINPLIIKCGDAVVGYAGVQPPETVIVMAPSETHLLSATTLKPLTTTTIEERTIRFPHPYPRDAAAGFTDGQNPYGIMP